MTLPGARPRPFFLTYIQICIEISKYEHAQRKPVQGPGGRPKAQNPLDAARRVYDIVVFIFVAFMAVLQVYTYRSALEGGSDLVKTVPAMVGLLFIALGNYLGKFPKNFFVGIRTPWTLASDVVWARTHRLAGWLFMAAGFVVVASVFFDSPPWVMISAIAAAALIPFVYSLVIYRKLEGFEPEDE
jgi:uncharacterized membrane protein